MKHEEIGEIAYELHAIEGDLVVLAISIESGGTYGKKAARQIRAVNERLTKLFWVANRLYNKTKKEEESNNERLQAEATGRE